VREKTTWGDQTKTHGTERNKNNKRKKKMIRKRRKSKIKETSAQTLVHRNQGQS
jgi:hypothetical protein